MLCDRKIWEFLVLMPRMQPPRFIWTVWKRTAVPFVKTMSMKCCHVWLSNPDWWPQRGRDVLGLRHKNSRSGSSQLCWKLHDHMKEFSPYPTWIWMSLVFVLCEWGRSPVASTCSAQTGANYNWRHFSPARPAGIILLFTSSNVCSPLLLTWCQDWNCKSSLPWGKAVSVLFLLTIPPLNQQDGSHQIWQS